MRIPKRKSEELRKRDDGPIYLSEDGLRRLEENLARFKAALPGLIEETQRTAAYGDRSENAEYKEAKSALRRANWQILSIQDQIKRVAVIASGPNTSGRVEIGSTVTLEVNGTKKIYQILGSRETDPARGRISYQSPLGAALMNHARNDIVVIQTEGGPREYRILEIR